MTDETTYPTIAAAEQAIIAAGYQRDNARHIWFNPTLNRTAKVVREINSQFSVQWG